MAASLLFTMYTIQPFIFGKRGCGSFLMMIKPGYAVLCGIALLLGSVWSIDLGRARAQQTSSFAAAVQRITHRPEFRHATFGIDFYSLDRDQPIFEMNPQELFTPASTTKLLTEGTALELLGPDYRFHTRVYRTGPIDADGTLHGDLVLVASGDPNLSQRIQPDGTLAFENEDHCYGGSFDTRAVPGIRWLCSASWLNRWLRTECGRLTGGFLWTLLCFRRARGNWERGWSFRPSSSTTTLLMSLLLPALLWVLRRP